MKKITMISAIVFAFVMTANLAFADCGFCGYNPCPCPATNISQSNSGTINSLTVAAGNSGLNSVSSKFGTASVTTNSVTAMTSSSNQLGWNEARVSGVTTNTLNVAQANGGTVNSMTFSGGNTGGNKAATCLGAAGVNAGAVNTGATSMNILGYNLTIK